MAAPDLATLASVGTLFTVLAGLAFGVVQLRQSEARRRDEAAVRLVQSVQDEKSFGAARFVCSLPDGMRAEDFRRLAPEHMLYVNQMQVLGETLGYMVYRRIVPLQLVDEMAGGALRVAWRKVKPWAEHTREVEGTPNAYEWFEWLVERMTERPVAWKARGAHVALKDWRP